MSFSCQMQYYVMTCDSTWVRTECNSSLPFQKHHPRGTQDKFPGSSSKVISWVEVCMLPDISWSCSLKDGLPVDYFVSFLGPPLRGHHAPLENPKLATIAVATYSHNAGHILAHQCACFHLPSLLQRALLRHMIYVEIYWDRLAPQPRPGLYRI